jgi:hypothetical protein
MSLIEIAEQSLIEGVGYTCDSMVYRFGLRLYQSFGGKAPNEFQAMIWALGIAGWIALAASTTVFVLWIFSRTGS